MTDQILDMVIEYIGQDIPRINHVLKVLTLAKHIGLNEKCDLKTQSIIEYAALLHDIGIHEAEKKYNSCTGNYQEIEGPPIALELLQNLYISEAIEERVLYIIGHHHSYDKIDGLDFQIVVEADCLVNIFEEGLDKAAAAEIKEKIFKTKSGTVLLERMYL